MRCIPSSLARWFIRSTNALVLPATSIAKATAASFAEPNSMPRRSSSTVSRSPASRPIVEEAP